MENKKATFFLSFLSLLFFVSLCKIVWAHGDTLTLDVAMKEAEQNSPSLQASAASADESDWGKTEAFAGFLPKLSLDATHFFNIRYQTLDFNLMGNQTTFPFVTPATTYALNASWSLFNGFQDTDRYEAAKLKSEAAHRDYEWSHFQVSQNVRLQFYQTVAEKMLESVAQENVTNLNRHLDQVEHLLKAGEAIQVDVLRVQVQLNNAKTQALNAHDSVIISQQQLAQALGKTTEGREPQASLPIPEESIAVQIEQLSKSESEKIAHRSDLQATDLRSEAAEKAERASTHYWIPTLSLVGNYQVYNNENFDAANSTYFKSAYQYGIELTWNIFDGLLSYARAKEAAAATIQAVKSEAASRLQAETDVKNGQNNYRIALSQFITGTENLDRSKKSVELALTGLRSGTQTNTDLLDAELDLFNARAGVVQSQLNAVDAQIKFENAIGRNL